MNTFVFAFWNPRHKDFESKMQEYLKLADPEEIKKLRSTGEEPKEEIVEEPKEGEKPKMR